MTEVVGHLSHGPTGRLRPTGSAPLAPRPDGEAARRGAAQLAAGVLEGRAFVVVTVPRTNLTGRMRLLTRSEAKQVRHEARLALTELGLEEASRAAAPESYREWHEEVVTRTIAVAVRLSDADHPLAPLEEWLECTDDQIECLWDRYRDLEHELNPLSEENASRISEADMLAIRAAAKKKGRRPLDQLRLRCAGELRDYYGRGAVDLTDTEVAVWWWAREEAERLAAEARKRARQPNRITGRNPAYDGP